MNTEEFSHKPPKEEEPLASTQEQPIEHPPEATEISVTPAEPLEAATEARQEPTVVAPKQPATPASQVSEEAVSTSSPVPPATQSQASAPQVPPAGTPPVQQQPVQSTPHYARPEAYQSVPQPSQAPGHMPGVYFPAQSYPQPGYQPGQPASAPLQPGAYYPQPGQQVPLQPGQQVQPGAYYPQSGQQASAPLQPGAYYAQAGQQISGPLQPGVHYPHPAPVPQQMPYPQPGQQVSGPLQPGVHYPQPGQQVSGPLQQGIHYPQPGQPVQPGAYYPQVGQQVSGPLQPGVHYPQPGQQAGVQYQQGVYYPQQPGYQPAQPVGAYPQGYQPGWTAYQQAVQPGGQYQPVNGYVPYPYGYAPTLQQPKRDGYLFGISITSLIASILAILGGLGAALFFALYSAVPFLPGGSAIDDKSLFNGMMMFAAFSIAGLAGGGFGMYHSIRSLIRKPSVNFRLPAYWIFFICYLAILVIGFLFAFSNQQLEGSFGLGLLVALGGIFPALGFWSLAAQLLSNARAKLWPTTWRRAVLSLISGATLSIALAMVLEMIFSLPFAALGGLSGDALPSSFQDLAGLLVVIAVIAPLVEEMVKPLAPVILIGRINSAAESFLLGMSAGIGFNLVETIGYISSDYSNWLTIALERSTAGLLHGVGAGMVALGWYYWTHRNSVKNRGWVGTACVLIAVLQHAIWNGSVILAYIPGPIGTFLREGVLVITNDIRIDAFVLVYVLLSVLILAMLLYVTQSIRLRPVYNMGSFQSVPSQAQQERAQAPVPVVPRPVAQQMPPVASQQAQQERAQAPVPVAPVVPQQERAQIPVPPIAPQQAIQGEQAPAVAEPPSSSEQLEPVASSELPATEQAERPVEESTPISEVTERPVQASPASSEQSTEETQTKE